MTFYHCRGGYVFLAVSVSVCVSVRVQNISKSYERVLVKFLEE